ncbi:MAG: SpoIIIAH-like family protein [Ruthenibacterium sp.]
MMKSAKSKRQLTLLTLVVALGVAVYLNREYAKTDTGFELLDGTSAVNAQTEEKVTEALPDKNYGDAQLVSTEAVVNQKYFEEARLARGKTRDEALDKLQKTLKSDNLGESEKKGLSDNIAATISGITTESDIENMIKAKGFADCVTFVNGDKINVAVQTGGTALDGASVAQIRDIVLGKMETQAKNITIVEVK